MTPAGSTVSRNRDTLRLCRGIRHTIVSMQKQLSSIGGKTRHGIVGPVVQRGPCMHRSRPCRTFLARKPDIAGIFLPANVGRMVSDREEKGLAIGTQHRILFVENR